MRCFGRSNAPKVPVRPKDVSQNDRDAAAVDGLQDTNDDGLQDTNDASYKC